MYTLYGLILASEMEFPQLRSTENKPDVHIGFSSLDHIPLPAENCWGKHRLGTDELLLNISGVAKFHISNGNRIIIDRYTNANDFEVRLFSIGACMGAILHQRRMLPIHGNGIVYDGQCTIFCGHSGQGKSTLSGVLIKRGYRALSDDVSAVATSLDAPPLVYPGLSDLKLWRDASKYLNFSWHKQNKISPDMEKYVVPLPQNAIDIPVPLKQLVVLQFHQRESFRIIELDGIDKIKTIQEQTYRYGLLKMLDERVKDHFQMCANIANQVPVVKALRPQKLSRLSAFTDLAEKIIRQTQ